MGAAREHGIVEAINTAGVQAVADTAYRGGGPAVRVRQRRRRLDTDTGRVAAVRSPEVNYAHAQPARPGERANGELKSWKILRKSAPVPAGPTALSKLSRSAPGGLTKPEMARPRQLIKCETSAGSFAGTRSRYDRSRSRYPAAMVDPAGGSFGSCVTGKYPQTDELGGPQGYLRPNLGRANGRRFA